MNLFPESEPEVLRYMRGEQVSPEEMEKIMRWASQSPERKQLLEDFRSGAPWIFERIRRSEQRDPSALWKKVIAGLEAKGFGPFPADTETFPVTEPAPLVSGKTFNWSLIAACFAGLAFLFIASPFSVPHGKPAVIEPGPPPIADIFPPGGNKATLTLTDGRNIVLDSSSSGLLADQAGTKIQKTDSGLTYTMSPSPKKAQSVLYNILQTPKAGQFSVTLPDGTQVWLNNVSSLRYPVSFTGNSREVELTGEAYFEVAEDKAHPFRVHILKRPGDREDAGTVEDRGTSFNIKAYSDEDTLYTTLVSGEASFYSKGKPSILSPGDRLLLSAGFKTVDHHVDVNRMTAWKNGNFNFYHSDLESTMRQLARWYDVEVVYEGKPAINYEFMGGINRNSTLEEILKALEPYGIHSRVEGRKIIVLK
jgi:transmembrane sensor